MTSNSKELIDELCEVLKQANRAINAAQAQIDAEWREHDKIADRHAAVVRAFRDSASAALAKLGEAP